jgi:hypothetical protein
MRAIRLKRPNGSWAPPIFDEAPLRRSIHARLRDLEGPFTITEPGVGSGPPRPKGEATERFTNRLQTGHIGLHLQLRNKDDKGIHGRVAETEPTPANTSGSPGVDVVVGFLNATFPGRWEQWGIYSFRNIAGTNTYSDHAYVKRPLWCGRAIDCHANTMATGDEIKKAALSEKAITSRLRYLLWRVPNHYDHLHFSLDDDGAPGSC